jgi:hypothetical protein
LIYREHRRSELRANLALLPYLRAAANAKRDDYREFERANREQLREPLRPK